LQLQISEYVGHAACVSWAKTDLAKHFGACLGYIYSYHLAEAYGKHLMITYPKGCGLLKGCHGTDCYAQPLGLY
jgi:hypothetical protein